MKRDASARAPFRADDISTHGTYKRVEGWTTRDRDDRRSLFIVESYSKAGTIRKGKQYLNREIADEFPVFLGTRGHQRASPKGIN